MKIRTRIIWISCAAVLAATLFGDAVIWILAGRSFREEAFAKAYQNAYVYAEDLIQTFDADQTLADNPIYLDYYFKTNWDDFNILIRVKNQYSSEDEWQEIYNHTVFTEEFLRDMEYQSNENMEYCNLDWSGRRYIVFRRPVGGNLCFFRIEDVSYVREKMEWLTVCMLSIIFVVTAVTVLLLSVILKHVLKPLQELNETTEYMARGYYDQRVHVRSKDEVGQLGESFNKMAEAVEARTRSMEESEKKKTLFMGNLTHELKTPMTAITGYAQTLLSVKLSEEQQEEALMYIYEECTRLERLSKKMMKLLELETESGLIFADTPVEQVFAAAEKSCGVILRDKEITLEISQHGEIFPMDADLMTDVLVNLIDNAVKASERGGTIVLKADKNVIEVQDFGCGIPEEEQEKILEPFYMIDKSRSRKSGGAGLGLALTAMIVKSHGAQLKIESEPGKGTRMILQFV
ncbi:MAG: HAMP domain-containing histidine kinase [Roseburia sp.]|nr:HAMP domain-containing histidine kinase [Roseburia sp.]